MAAGDVTPYHELLLPALQAVGELGGSASIGEIVETVIKREGFSDAQQAVLHNDGPETEIGYRLAWARTYLKGMGLLTNSSRGVWAVTDDGTALLTDPSATDDQRSERIQELRARYITELRMARKTRLPQDVDEPDDAQPSPERSWKEQLLEQLMSMPPDAFERLARRLLREADFDSVNVTGQSGDGGIDGLGVYRLGLVSFPVFFQCKRYRGSVSPSAASLPIPAPVVANRSTSVGGTSTWISERSASPARPPSSPDSASRGRPRAVGLALSASTLKPCRCSGIIASAKPRSG
jgi:restriction system protein